MQPQLLCPPPNFSNQLARIRRAFGDGRCNGFDLMAIIGVVTKASIHASTPLRNASGR
jgi:hypothetical protein